MKLTTTTSIQINGEPVTHGDRPCPACGYCPTCGRGGYYMVPYITPWPNMQPVNPYPWYQPIWYYSTNEYYTLPSITVTIS